MTQEVLWEKRGHIRILTFNRPEAMNAMNLEMMQLHGQYLQEFIGDDDSWVLIFTGTGRAFSTGLDIKALKTILSAPNPPKTLTSPDAPIVWKPLIAAINGYAVGLGCELALACDLRIAADDAQIGLLEVKRAMIPGAGGCGRLPRLVSLGNALMMLFTGDRIDAQEAYRIGLVQKVVPRDRLLDEAVQLGEKICENGPAAVRGIKEAVYRGLDMPSREAVVVNRLFDLRNQRVSAEDIEEGAKAFIEKRKPVYKGR
jgi:enoyl-CoA hydratase/carnithine racemase